MFSQTTEYALRATVWLAYSGPDLTPTSILAEQTGVPFNYLAKVLQSLAQAGLIVGRRGVGGGYRLARDPTEITMLDVITAIAPVKPIECCPLGMTGHGSALCPLHRQLDQAAQQMIRHFDAVSLASLLDEHEQCRPLCEPDSQRSMRLTMDGRGVVPGEGS